MILKGNNQMKKTKKQKAIGYTSVTSLLTLLAGLFVGTALAAPSSQWTILFLLAFIIIIFRVMFLVAEIDLFYTRNFDNEPVIEIEKEFKAKLKRVLKLK